MPRRVYDVYTRSGGSRQVASLRCSIAASSGGRQRFGAIRKQGNSMAGFLLVEGAQTAARYDAELRRDYQRLKFRRGTAVAKIAIARKLAVRLYWKLRQQHSALPPTGMQGSPEHPVVGASLSRN